MKSKKMIIAYILGVISTLSITVLAGVLYKAEDVEFIPKNEEWNVSNVQEAINNIEHSYIPKGEFVGKTWEYNYNGITGEDGTAQTFETFVAGTYKIELWGAQGGTPNSSAPGGKGAYTSGLIKLPKNQTLYIYVGGAGLYTPASTTKKLYGGYNGGGPTSGQSCCGRMYGSGGGATDVRLEPGNWDDIKSLRSRIMVAAGGGGSLAGDGDWGPVSGGSGGILAGLNGQQKTTTNSYCYGEGATQLRGGIITYNCNQASTFDHNPASFGVGRGGDTCTGGGGGYYGGGRSGHVASAGGGSSYISGYTGCIAVESIDSTSPRSGTDDAECKENTTDNLCSIHYSELSFISPTIIAGNGDRPANNAKKISNAETGYAKITLVSVD